MNSDSQWKRGDKKVLVNSRQQRWRDNRFLKLSFFSKGGVINEVTYCLQKWNKSTKLLIVTYMQFKLHWDFIKPKFKYKWDDKKLIKCSDISTNLPVFSNWLADDWHLTLSQPQRSYKSRTQHLIKPQVKVWYAVHVTSIALGWTSVSKKARYGLNQEGRKVMRKMESLAVGETCQPMLQAATGLYSRVKLFWNYV